MSTEFTGSMKVSLEIIRLSSKAGRNILNSTPQNSETDNPVPTRNTEGKHLRREPYRSG
jgi:hypothetical protein